MSKLIASSELQDIRLSEFRNSKKYLKKLGGKEFIVHPNVYFMGTDTRLMVETMHIDEGDEVLDLCTGNGAIACMAALMGAEKVIGTDLNPAAIQNAIDNKCHLSLKNVEFIETNLFGSIKQKFDVITINPPYTNKKPTDLTDICFYDSGHNTVKSFFRQLTSFLKPRGRAYIAWSNLSTMDLLPDLAGQNGLSIRFLAESKGRNGYSFFVYELGIQ